MNKDVASKSSSCPIGVFDKCVEMRKGNSLFQVLKAEKEKQDIHHRERIEQLLDKQGRELQDLGKPQGGATWPRHRQFRDTHLKEVQTQQKSGNVTLSKNLLLYWNSPQFSLLCICPFLKIQTRPWEVQVWSLTVCQVPASALPCCVVWVSPSLTKAQLGHL